MSSNKLSKSMSGFSLWATASGMLIGPWIMYTKWFWQLTGPSIVIAFTLSALVILPIAFVFAELCAMLPASGGTFLYSSVAFGPNVGFFAAWLSSLAYMSLLAGNSSMAISLFQLIGIAPDSGALRIVTSLLLILFYFILNKMKVNMAAKVTSFITIGLIICGIAINGGLLGMSGQWTIQNFKPFLINGYSGLYTTVGILITMYFGFEAIPQFIEEANIPVKKSASILIMGIGTAWLVYTIAMIGIAGVTPVTKMLEGKIASATVILDVWQGNIIGKIGFATAVGITAFGTIASGNGFWLALTRLYYSLGRSRALPETFSKVNKNQVPSNANMLVFIVVTTLVLFSGSGWLELLYLLMTLSITIVFFLGCLSFIKLRISHPEWNRPFKLPGGLTFGIIGLIASIYCIACAAKSISLRGWIAFVAYCILGVVFILYNNYALKKKGISQLIYNPDTKRIS